MLKPESEAGESMPVVRDRHEFNVQSGSRLERLIFNNRLPILLICLIATLFLGFQATHLRMNASFEKMLPRSQPFIVNYLANRDKLGGLGNALRIVVENQSGDIYSPRYVKTLEAINDEVFLIRGVDRLFMTSLWTPQVRWTQITEEGYRGGPVMPDDYDGSPAAIRKLKVNVGRAGIVGSVVSNDQRSSMLFVPLLDEKQLGSPLDYAAFSREIDSNLRAHDGEGIKIHIIGFAKLVGDLIDDLWRVLTFFGFAAAIAALVIFSYTRCIRSTVLVLSCSLAAVVWQLGIIAMLGFVIDPYSILVPFLVFAIGVSHGAQKMNGIMQDVGRGTHRYVAARYTFRRLFVAGLTALAADAVGFAVLMIIEIPVIRDLAMTASIGVAVLVFTNLVLLPITLSYIGVSSSAAVRSLNADLSRGGLSHLWDFLDRFTERAWAFGVLAGALLLTITAYTVSLHIKTGDLDPGAPELRANSQYNRDNAFITSHFSLSSDLFAVMVKTVPDGMATFRTLLEEDRLEQKLRQLPSVESTESAASLARFGTSGMNEGSPKWLTINREKAVVSQATFDLLTNKPELIDHDGTFGVVIAYLTDHKAASLSSVVDTVQKFAATHDDSDRKFLLAAGSAGIEAATNIAVSAANQRMLFLVYAAVIVLCLVTFRSWRAVIVAVVPLAMTSIMCEALMVILGIGVKVATLPVVALGVGIGVDYALYLLSVQLAHQRAGYSLHEAHRMAVRFTGKVVALVGVTLAAGVVTWAWSPIKFQADMGILLTFMFLWNMIGALVLIPALSHFLLQTRKFRPRMAHGSVSAAGQPQAH